jgi:energy-coupling factor transporter ATP-binding protein EcfA2
MKLREIQIDRFGVWNDLTLPIHSGGVTVVYGPNEAGKTTLLQFIRGVLYGYQRAPAGRNPRLVGHERMSGSLLIEEAGRTHRFHRAAVGVLRGNPCLIGEETAQPAGELLEQMLHGISEHVFNSVFSIELRELQELAGLSSGEVAEHIYGTSLGPEGRDLLAAGRNIDAGSHRLIDPLQQSGELVRLFEQHDELSSRLRSLESATQQHEELCARRDDIEQEIAELKRRLGGIQSQLRGHLFLERAWGPWNRLQECERELDSLPQIAGFPEHGLERLHRLESEIAEARECRDRLSAEIKELRAQWKALPVDDAFRRHAATIKGLVAQQSWLAELDERIAQAQQSADDAGLAYEAVREKLGADCTENRLANFDTAPLSRERLFGTAESFRGALARRGRIRRECRRLAQVCRRKTVAVRDGLKSLGVESAEQALAASRRRLDDLQRIARLELHEADLQRRLGDVRERLTEAVSHNDLPTWVYIVLGVFCFSGIVLAGWGLITGVSTSWIAGGVYAMLALTCAGLAWGIRQHFEVHTAERVAALNSRASKWHTQLAQTQDTLRQLKLDAVIPNQPADQALSVPRDTAALVRQELLFAAEIEELARHRVARARPERAPARTPAETRCRPPGSRNGTLQLGRSDPQSRDA